MARQVIGTVIKVMQLNSVLLSTDAMSQNRKFGANNRAYEIASWFTYFLFNRLYLRVSKGQLDMGNTTWLIYVKYRRPSNTFTNQMTERPLTE